MDDDEYGEVEERGRSARLNWADVAFSMLAPWRGFFEGCHDGVHNLMAALAQHSGDIGERQAFKREAGRFIESLNLRED